MASVMAAYSPPVDGEGELQDSKLTPKTNNITVIICFFFIRLPFVSDKIGFFITRSFRVPINKGLFSAAIQIAKKHFPSNKPTLKGVPGYLKKAKPLIP